MQILHPFLGSIEKYQEQLSDPNRHRPQYCPQCQAQSPLTAHGFYTRTLIDQAFDGIIRVRRYLCRSCKRTVSLVPDFVLPYLRASIALIALFLVARLLHNQTLQTAVGKTAVATMVYQRGQFWIRRFQQHAASLCAALAGLTTAALPATDFVRRGLLMLQATGGVSAHRFLFAELRYHLLGWPRSLAPDGRRATLPSANAPTHTICLESARLAP
jgi:Domain of unknown function (DUF6431)